MNNNGSDSGNKNVKKKISFDINSAKAAGDASTESSSATMPVFSIKKKHADSAKTAEKSGAIRHEPTSDRPVFEIHGDTKSQASAQSEVPVSDSTKPKITVQSIIPPTSESNAPESQESDGESEVVGGTPSLSEESIEASLEPSISVATEMSESLDPQANAESVEGSVDYMTSLNIELKKLQRELDASSISLTPESESATVTNEGQSLTREAYRGSLDETVNEQSETSITESLEQSQPTAPRPPRPQKDEKVEPIFAEPEKDETAKRQPKVEWNGPQVQREEQPKPKTEPHRSVHAHTETRHSSRISSRAHRKPEKQSGVLGKSFLAMLGLGNKDE